MTNIVVREVHQSVRNPHINTIFILYHRNDRKDLDNNNDMELWTHVDNEREPGIFYII